MQALHLGQTFDYFIDEKDSEAAQPGVLVRVRFGSQRVSGVIWARTDTSDTPRSSIRYIHATKELQSLVDSLEGDEKTGARIIMKALEAPLYHIAANAGLEGSVIINKVRESQVGVGFDAYKEEYVDMVKAGILDPAKVTRSALQNATSVASTLLTTESVVSIIKEDTPAMPAGNPGMGMM